MLVWKTEETYSSRPNLKDEPLPNPDVEWFIVQSIFMHEGVRKAGYVVVSQQKVIDAKTLPSDTSA